MQNKTEASGRMMGMFAKIFAGLLAFCFFSLTTLPSSAYTSAGSNRSKKIHKPIRSEEKPLLNFSAKLSIAELQSVVNHMDGTASRITQFTGVFAVEILNRGNINLTIINDQNQKDSSKSDFWDTELRYGFPDYRIHTASDWHVDWASEIGAVIPTSKDSIENQEMQGGGVVTTGFNFSSQNSVIKQNYSIALEGYRLFHKYDTGIDGSSNYQWLVDQAVSAKLGYGMFNVFANFIHLDMWTYDQNVTGKFLHKEGIGFTPAPFISFQVGHMNTGNVYRPNGYSGNVNTFDENSSVYFLKMGLSI